MRERTQRGCSIATLHNRVAPNRALGTDSPAFYAACTLSRGRPIERVLDRGSDGSALGVCCTRWSNSAGTTDRRFAQNA